jgi:hypothetical protein
MDHRFTVHGSAMAYENFLKCRQFHAPVRVTAACLRLPDYAIPRALARLHARLH